MTSQMTSQMTSIPSLITEEFLEQFNVDATNRNIVEMKHLPCGQRFVMIYRASLARIEPTTDLPTEERLIAIRDTIHRFTGFRQMLKGAEDTTMFVSILYDRRLIIPWLKEMCEGLSGLVKMLYETHLAVGEDYENCEKILQEYEDHKKKGEIIQRREAFLLSLSQKYQEVYKTMTHEEKELFWWERKI